MASIIRDPKNLTPDTNDLDVIAQTYRVVSDLDGFEDLILAWEKRLNEADETTAPAIHLFIRSHVEKAIELLEDPRVQFAEDEFGGVMTEANTASALFSAQGYLIAVNEEWSGLFGHRQGQEIGDEWILPDSREPFRKIVESASNGRNLRHGLIRIVDSKEKQHVAEVLQLDETASNRKAAIAVRLLEPNWTPAVAARLEEVFGLTKAETEICQLLLQHRDTADVAEARQTSPRTVRLQLGSIFQKTGASSQVDLVRLLALLCTRMEAGKGAIVNAWSDPYGREKLFRDRKGRQLAYTWIGAEDGIPFILVHGPGLGYALPTEAETRLRSEGLKLIALSRPGYGNSEQLTKLSVVEDSTLALKALLDHLKMDKFHGIGLGAGATPITCLGAETPERLKSLIALGGFYPANTRERRKRLPPVQKILFELEPFAPWATRMISKVGIRNMKERGHDWYLDKAFAHSPADLELLEDTTIRTLMRNASGLMSHQGSDAFARDLYLSLHDTVEDLKRLTCPVWFMIGDQDTIMPESAKSELLSACKQGYLEDCAGAGALVYYKNWPQMIDLMMKAARQCNDT